MTEDKEEGDEIIPEINEENYVMMKNHSLKEGFHDKVKNSKIFKIDENILNILQNTDNYIGYRKLPFQNIIFFSNKEIELPIGKLDRIRFSEDLEKSGKDPSKFKKYFPDKVKVTSILLEEISVKHNEFTDTDKGIKIHYIGKYLSKYHGEGDSFYGFWNILNKYRTIPWKSKSYRFSFDDYLSLFVCNFLDFLNHPEIETRILKHPTNEKRISRGKPPIPDRARIRIKGKLRRYLYEELPKKEHISPEHKFWVRGHFMHFWNEKKWKNLYKKDKEELEEKGYQVDDRGIISKWRMPFIKGQGELKNKPYHLK